MRKGFLVSQSVGRSVAASHIAHSGSVRAAAAAQPPLCPWLAITGGGVSRGGMGSQSETQLAGAAGISRVGPRPASVRVHPFGQVIFFQLEKHFVQRSPLLILARVL